MRPALGIREREAGQLLGDFPLGRGTLELGKWGRRQALEGDSRPSGRGAETRREKSQRAAEHHQRHPEQRGARGRFHEAARAARERAAKAPAFM